MRNSLKISLVLFVFVLTSFGTHKFYTAIYQIDYSQKNQRIEITTRIFIDDLNDALEKKFKQKTHLGLENESPNDIKLMNDYLSEKMKFKVNSQSKSFQFVSKEIDNNVLVCYFKINGISKFKSLEIQNSILTELHSEQQNIIQFNNNGKKQNLLLTDEKQNGIFK